MSPPSAHHVANTSRVFKTNSSTSLRAGASQARAPPGSPAAAEAPGAGAGNAQRAADRAAPSPRTGPEPRRPGAAAGCEGRRRPAAPLPRPRRKRLGFERCRGRRPPPAEPQRAEPPPATALPPGPSIGRRGLPARPMLASPAHPRPSVLRGEIRSSRRPRPHWAPPARRRGRGPPAAASTGVSPPPPAEKGWRCRLFLPVSPRTLPRSVSPTRKAASSAGAAARSSGPDHRQTPPPGAAAPARAASSARGRETPGPPLPPPPRALAPARGPGTRGQRTVGPPAAPAFATPPSRLARAPVGTSGSFAVSRVLATVPRPSLTLAAPALFLCRIPPESQNNWGRAGAKKETERAGRVGAVRGDGKRN